MEFLNEYIQMVTDNSDSSGSHIIFNAVPLSVLFRIVFNECFKNVKKMVGFLS